MSLLLLAPKIPPTPLAPEVVAVIVIEERHPFIKSGPSPRPTTPAIRVLEPVTVRVPSDVQLRTMATPPVNTTNHTTSSCHIQIYITVFNDTLR